MEPDRMSVRLHLRRIRVVAVLVDVIERLVVEVADTRRVVRCPYCGFRTVRVHDRRRFGVKDLPAHGRPTTLTWARRRFGCGECGERFWEDHPEIIVGRRTHVTRRLARQLVRDANVMSIREVARRHDLPWHYIMGLTRDWSELVAAERRRRRCRVLLIDETSLRRGHRYVTVIINGDTGETLGIVAHLAFACRVLGDVGEPQPVRFGRNHGSRDPTRSACSGSCDTSAGQKAPRGPDGASPVPRCSERPSCPDPTPVRRGPGGHRRPDGTRRGPDGSHRRPSHAAPPVPTACDAASCTTLTPTPPPPDRSPRPGGPRSRSERRPPTAFWVRLGLQQFVRPFRHRQLSLELTDPLPRSSQLGGPTR